MSVTCYNTCYKQQLSKNCLFYFAIFFVFVTYTLPVCVFIFQDQMFYYIFKTKNQKKPANVQYFIQPIKHIKLHNFL